MNRNCLRMQLTYEMKFMQQGEEMILNQDCQRLCGLMVF